MLRIKKILHPTDFSDGSQPALTEAIRLARRHDAELYPIHVIVLLASEPNHPGMPMLADSQVYARLNDTCQAALEKMRHELGSNGVRIHLETHRGFSVADVICERSHALDVDLVVMGTHGRRGARRLLIGSVAEWVVRSIDRPMLVVRQGDDGPVEEHAIDRILVPIDFSDYTAPTLHAARLLAHHYGAKLDIVHVLHLETHPFYGATTVHDLTDRLRERCREEIAELWQSAGGPEVEYEVHLPTGRPPTVVADFVEANDVDLVVVNSHGHGVERMLLGSTAEGILRRCHCPVMVLRADGKTLIDDSEADGS